jgi:septal ring factor EnvC (AmiA/AmiB activator)
MADYATKNDVQEIVDKAVNDLSAVMSQFANDVNNRFDKVESDISDIKQEITDLKASHDRLLNTIDGFIGRIDTYETELAARDAQFARLLEWAKEVSKKTGIPLKGF